MASEQVTLFVAGRAGRKNVEKTPEFGCMQVAGNLIKFVERGFSRAYRQKPGL